MVDDKDFVNSEIGETFWESRDGYYQKLPHDYCIMVDLRSESQLFKVDVERLKDNGYGYEEWSLFESQPKLEGHFIRGYYTSDYLIMCEEHKNGDLSYIIFDFLSEEIQCYYEVEKIYEFLNVDSIPWFSLCNTNQQILQ